MKSVAATRTQSKKARAGSKKYPSHRTDWWDNITLPYISPFNAPTMTNASRYQDIGEVFAAGSGQVYRMIVSG